jgi:prepilin-type N-terminal cleavage/methylation domain-containing protein
MVLKRPGARGARGFTLAELAVVTAIIGLLLASALYTLSAQTDQRNFEETRRRLEAARELLLAFAIVNGRLPCPASTTSNGDEAPLGGGLCTCLNGTCTTPIANQPPVGWLPARSIGYQIVDTAGYAIDAWGNRIRYAVSGVALTGCLGTLPHFTNTTNLRTNGLTCQPNDLVVCRTATGIIASSCNTALPVTNQNTLVAIVYSTGKNGAGGSAGTDEAANLNGDRVFVWHTPTPVGAANGEFDDQMAWISVGELYGRLVAAGALP